jgi:hypothetical protein
MNTNSVLPGFTAEASLGKTALPYAGMVISAAALNQVVPQILLAPESSTLSLPPGTCVDILYAPVCRQINPFTVCCKRSHELKCPVPGSPNCTTSRVDSCTECHSTVLGFHTNGVFKV